MNILYIAHTKERVLRDAHFSILTLLKYANNPDLPITIWLFTDQPEYFDLPQVKIVQLTLEMLRAWYGEINFIHRQKMMAIRYVAERSAGDFLMLDGDVYFIKDPAPLFGQLNGKTSLMHLSEGKIGNLQTKSGKKLRSLAESGKFDNFSPDTVMFNAGVIGFVRENLELEDEVLHLTEALYRTLPMHIMEQIAHSVILGKHTQILEAAEYIYHWWGRGLKVKPILIEFFEQAKGMDLAGRIKLAEEYKIKVGQAPFNDKPGFWEKLWKKLK